MTPSDYADRIDTVATAACTVDAILRRRKGLDAKTWGQLDDSEKGRWRAWVEQILRGAKMSDNDRVIVAVARSVAAELDLLVVTTCSVMDVKRDVAQRFELTVARLEGPDRSASTSLARHIGMYLCHRMRLSFPETARAFGRDDHTSAIYAVRKIERLMKSTPAVASHVHALATALGIDLKIAEPEPPASAPRAVVGKEVETHAA